MPANAGRGLRGTQDGGNADTPVRKNPRVVEARVGDGVNTKRTTIEYLPVSQGSTTALFGLVSAVNVYDSDLSTVI
ncbi:MAG: hypothetical protein ACRD6X_21130, partial [Pyrinomonadaceae bacterium]